MLKKKLLSLSILGLFLMGAFHGKSQNLVIKINPLSLAAVTANIQAEYALNEKMSAQLGFFIGSVNLGFGADGVDGGVGYTWFGITPEFRYYAQNKTKDAPRGLYVAPFVRYRSIRTKYEGSIEDPDNAGLVTTGEITASINAIGGGVLLGYQWLFGDVFALDMFIGPQYSQANTTLKASCENCDGTEDVFSESAGLSFGGIGIRAGLAVGVAF